MPAITNRPAPAPAEQATTDAGIPAPGSDVYIDATRAVSEEERDPGQARIDDDRESARVAGGDPDVVPPPRADDADTDADAAIP
jgi:hypothetical protein